MSPNPSTIQQGLTRQGEQIKLHLGETIFTITALNRAVGFETRSQLENSDGSVETIRTYNVLTSTQATDLIFGLHTSMMSALED